MTEVIMPKMGDAMEEGTLVEWLKSAGQEVLAGEVIGTIQTDKATLELESPASGIFDGQLIQGGDTVPVGKAIAAILSAGEKLPDSWGKQNSSGKVEESNDPKLSTENTQPNIESLINSIPKQETRIIATPLAKKIAKEKGIDLYSVQGTGPGGRITEKDVLQVTGPKQSLSENKAPSSKVVPVAGTRVPLNRLKQITGQRTQHSKQYVPHFYVTVEVDLERILEYREQMELEQSGKLSINDFVVRASALALKDMPEVNASFEEKELILHPEVNVGIAAAVDEGLMVPVIKSADQLSLRQISAKAKELVKKARDGKLSPDEMSNPTFSISNMGMFDVDNFIAIIYEPNSAIIAVGSAKKMAIINDDNEIEIRTRVKISGSFDHRVLDGAKGAQFMNAIRAYLENPTRLLS
jgi:pyruvate dehydrogenase E2 component (dihydrolipoamide acetyltransferase)